MTEQQNKYLANQIQRAHNLETERIQDYESKTGRMQANASTRQANTAQYRAETERAELMTVKPYSTAAQMVSSVGTVLRGIGSVGSIFS